MRLKSEFESLRKRGRFSEPISFAAELHIISTLRLEKLYESCVLRCWGLALSRAEPPAGPPKFDLIFADASFPEISVIFGIMPGPILIGNFF